MAFSKITSVELNSRGATTLDNKPTISAQRLKEEFDAPSKEIVAPAVNRLVDELSADTAASNIGASVPSGLPEGTPKNIQGIMGALNTEVQSNKGQSHSHANKAILDTITDDIVMDADYVHTDNNFTDDEKSKVASAVQDSDYVHTDNNYTDADMALVASAVQDSNYVHTDNNYTSYEKTSVAENTTARHTHDNKDLLDTYTQTETNLADAVTKKHSHSNKTVIDKFGESAEGKPLYDGQPIGGGSGGSSVSWQQNVTEGTEIAEITIDGTATKVYAPTGGGGSSTDYTTLTSKPQINGETLVSNKTSSQLGLVSSATTVNGKALSSNVTLDASDVGALPDDTEIPTEQTVANWGFTKNTGTYSKPDTGIPESDLAESITKKIANLDEDGQIDYENVKNTPTVPTKVSDLDNDSGYVTESALDEWLPEVTLDGTGEQTVSFTVDATKAYELWFESPYGSQVTVKSSSLSNNTLTYVLDVPSNENGTKVRLRIVK